MSHLKLRTTLCLSALSFLCAAPLASQHSDKRLELFGFWKAGDYLKLNQEQQVVYAVGFVDGISMAPFLCAPQNGKNVAGLKDCIDGGIQTTRIATIME